MKKIALVTIATVSLLSGCATFNKRAIEPAAAASLKGETVSMISYAKTDFSEGTPAKMAFGMLGAMAAVSAGNELVTVNKVDDPAKAISLSLAEALEAKHSSSVVQPAIAVSSEDLGAITKSVNQMSKYIIDVKTVGWNLFYFPTNWTHYRVMYAARARLIDSGTSKVLAEGFCNIVPEETPTAPTYDDLMANEATLLKKILADHAESCSKTLKSEMFSI